MPEYESVISVKMLVGLQVTIKLQSPTDGVRSMNQTWWDRDNEELCKIILLHSSGAQQLVDISRVEQNTAQSHCP